MTGEAFSEGVILTSVRFGKPGKDVPFHVHPDQDQTVIGYVLEPKDRLNDRAHLVAPKIAQHPEMKGTPSSVNWNQ